MYARMTDRLEYIGELPFRITLPDGSTRTSLHELTQTELAELGIYPVTEVLPEYDPATQRLVGPELELADGVVTATYTAEDKSPEELANELASAQGRKMMEIDRAWKHEIESVGMPVEGLDYRLDFGLDDQIIWREGVADLPADATEKVETWDIENRPHMMPVEIYKIIPDLQKAYFAQITQGKKWALRKQILAATTVEELEAIHW